MLWTENQATYRENTGFYFVVTKKQSGIFGEKDPGIVFRDSSGNIPKTYKRLYLRILNM